MATLHITSPRSLWHECVSELCRDHPCHLQSSESEPVKDNPFGSGTDKAQDIAQVWTR